MDERWGSVGAAEKDCWHCMVVRIYLIVHCCAQGDEGGTVEILASLSDPNPGSNGRPGMF